MVNLKWFFWLASVILLLAATLVAAGAITVANGAWLFPAGVLAFVLASAVPWVVP